MKVLFFTFMILSTIHNMLSADTLSIGSTSPQITALSDQAEIINLKEALAQGTTLVFFYPKAMTPGCTKQACSLRDAWDDLSARNVQVFGVSCDKVETQATFKKKYELPYTLIADKDGEVSAAFNRGRFSRHAYLFKDGQLIWRDLNASTRSQATDVLTVLDQLEK